MLLGTPKYLRIPGITRFLGDGSTRVN